MNFAGRYSQLLILTLLVDCSGRAKDSPPAAAIKSVDMAVEPVSFERQLEILALARSKGEGASQMLAYSVANTGCDYRAAYLSIELAAAGLQTTAFYALTRTGFKLSPKPGTTWTYHVAASFEINGEDFIIDPSFRAMGTSDEILFSKSQWKDLLHVEKQAFWTPMHGDEGLREFYYTGSYTLLDYHRIRMQGETAQLKGDALLKFRQDQDQIRLQTFASMPAFSMRDINEVCRSLTILLQEEDAAALASQEKVSAKLEALSLALDEKAKLQKDSPFDCTARRP